MKKNQLANVFVSGFAVVLAVACGDKKPVRSSVVPPTAEAQKVDPTQKSPDTPAKTGNPVPVVSNPTQGQDVFKAPDAKDDVALVAAPSVNGKWEFQGYSCAGNAKLTKVAEFENNLLKVGLILDSSAVGNAASANGAQPLAKRNFTWDLVLGDRSTSFRKTHFSVSNLKLSGFADIDKRITVTEPSAGKLKIEHHKIENVSLSQADGKSIDIQPVLDFVSAKLSDVMKNQDANSVYASLPQQAQDFLVWIQKLVETNQQAVKAAGDVMQSLIESTETVDYTVTADTLTMTNSRVALSKYVNGHDFSSDRVDDIMCYEAGKNSVAIRTYKRVK